MYVCEDCGFKVTREQERDWTGVHLCKIDPNDEERMKRFKERWGDD